MFKHKTSTLFIIILIMLLQMPSVEAVPSRKQNQTQVTVLAYHEIIDTDKSLIRNSAVISLEDFKAQMKYLHDNSFNVITMQQMKDFVLKKKKLPKKSVLITFDDGYKSSYTYAYPILKEYNFHTTIFVITGFTSDQPAEASNNGKLLYLSKPELEIAKDIFEYGCHTYNSHKLTENNISILKSLDLEDLCIDFQNSSQVIKTECFAYPYGQYNDRVIEALKNNKFSMAFSITPGYVSQGDNPYQLKRFSIFPTTSLKNFIDIVNQKTIK